MNNNLVPGLVSIITPAYNASKTIQKTIDSVEHQTYENWEMIIVNDASKDNTAEIIAANANQEPRIKVINLKKNGGPVNAWNQAFDVMKGQYVAFLDSDDIWEKDKLCGQIEFMEKNHYGFTYSMYDWIGMDDKPLNKVITIPDSMNYSQMMKNSNIGLLTVIIDRRYVNIDFHLPIVKMAWDFLLWARILENGVVAHGYQKITAHYRITTGSASRNKKKAAKGKWELYKNELHVPFFRRVYYFACYAASSIKRYYF